jgi:hypothetical protein
MVYNTVNDTLLFLGLSNVIFGIKIRKGKLFDEQ